MKRKKLLVDAHTFDENHQGIRTFMKGVYSAIKFDPEELEVILVANNIENLQREFSNQKNFKFVQLHYTNKYLRLGYEIPKIIRSFNVDFAHFNYFLPLFLRRSCNYIVTLHDVLFIDFPDFFPKKYQIINSFMYRRSARKAQIVTTVSDYSKQMIRKHFGITNKAITILPNAAGELYWKDHDKVKDKGYIKEKYGLEKYLIFVSRFEPRKNHLIMLQAFQDLELWKEGYSVLFIGKETFKNYELDEKINELNSISPNMITILEDINNDLLVKFYNASELSIFPSLCEGFGIPPIESAILQTPTLCSNITAMSDFEFFGEFLFDPTDLEELKQKIRMVLDKDHSRTFESISKEIKSLYDWNNTSRILYKLIQDH